MQNIFEFLFKYSPFFFRNGSFGLQWGPSAALLIAAIVGLVAITTVLYWKRWLTFDRKPGFYLFSLRLLFLLFLGFLLMKPSLTLSTVVPRENMLAVLVDNSQSMGIAEQDGVPRGEPLKALLAPQSEFMQELDQKFVVRPFLFDGEAATQTLPLGLDFSGGQTNLTAGLKQVVAEMRNLPLAGIVVFSDGADNSYSDLEPVLSELRAGSVAVYPVGIGEEAVQDDVELVQVSMARQVLEGSVTAARLSFKQDGFGGSRGQIQVRENNVLIASEEVHFPLDSSTYVTEITLHPKNPGMQNYEFTLLPLEGERLVKNNSRRTVMEVRSDRPRILYVEGRPRWEYKFIRRAVRNDENLRVETLLRTALNKFYRQGIEEETTLATGFPDDQETLFEYQGIILGSVESSFFSYAQMEMIKQFVSKRGGGFLMVGGSDSFSEGAYQNTPIESLLPVRLGSGGAVFAGEGRLVTTPQGGIHPALQLTGDDGSWDSMGLLKDWNLTQGTKPGTTVLARVALPGQERRQGNPPLLAFQRFGRGQAIALTSGSSWRWRMLQDSSDRRHETFWRQMLRWLVSLSREQVSVEAQRQAYVPNEIVEIRAEVHDESFNRVNDATVEARITLPSGQQEQLQLPWSAQEDGVYVGRFVAREGGLHGASVTANRRSATTVYGSADTSFLVETETREFFDSTQKRGFLETLAQTTGGRYYSLQEADRLPEEIVFTDRESSTIEVLELWDMPVNFLILLSLLLGEWVLRKRHGVI